jgi:hypothetical protein
MTPIAEGSVHSVSPGPESPHGQNVPKSPALESIFLPFVEEISLCLTQVDDLRTPIPVLLHLRALFAVVRIGNASASADDALAFVRTVIALIAQAHNIARPHVGVADHALPVALVAQAPNSNSALFAAHHEIGMMLRHIAVLSLVAQPPGSHARTARDAQKKFDLAVQKITDPHVHYIS